ncbi:MAG: FAD binding domain-containing protein [Caldisericaceae bacterium]
MLKLKSVEECFYPKTLDEALTLLKEKGNEAMLVGGGLHITVFPNPTIKSLIFLDKVGLDYIKETENAVVIGATANITEATENEIIKRLFSGMLSEVLSTIASELLRNQITFGGSIAQREPYSDVATLLLALDATLVLFDGSSKTMKLSEFYEQDFRSILKNSIIQEIIFEKGKANGKFKMERFIRNATDIALFNMAAKGEIEDGSIKNIYIAYGSRPMAATRFKELEEFLRNKSLDEAIISAPKFAQEKASIAGDVRISEEYRRELTYTFTKRILESFRG